MLGQATKIFNKISCLIKITAIFTSVNITLNAEQIKISPPLEINISYQVDPDSPVNINTAKATKTEIEQKWPEICKLWGESLTDENLIPSAVFKTFKCKPLQNPINYDSLTWKLIFKNSHNLGMQIIISFGKHIAASQALPASEHNLDILRSKNIIDTISAIMIDNLPILSNATKTTSTEMIFYELFYNKKNSLWKADVKTNPKFSDDLWAHYKSGPGSKTTALKSDLENIYTETERRLDYGFIHPKIYDTLSLWNLNIRYKNSLSPWILSKFNAIEISSCFNEGFFLGACANYKAWLKTTEKTQTETSMELKNFSLAWRFGIPIRHSPHIIKIYPKINFWDLKAKLSQTTVDGRTLISDFTNKPSIIYSLKLEYEVRIDRLGFQYIFENTIPITKEKELNLISNEIALNFEINPAATLTSSIKLFTTIQQYFFKNFSPANTDIPYISQITFNQFYIGTEYSIYW